MSHDLSPLIRIGSLGERKRERERETHLSQKSVDLEDLTSSLEYFLINLYFLFGSPSSSPGLAVTIAMSNSNDQLSSNHCDQFTDSSYR